HDKRVHYFNHAYVRLFDMDENWLSTGPTLGEVLDDLYRRRKMQEQSDYAAYKRQWQDSIHSGLSPLEELTHLPDGRTLRHLTAPHPLGGLILIFEDVTSTLKLEREYNTQLAVHRASLDNLKEGVAVLGSDNCLRLYNPALADLWQLGPRQLKPNMHISKVAEHLRKYFDYGDNWIVFRDKLVARITDRIKKEQRIQRKDGKVIDFTYSPLPDGSHLISCIDMTDSVRIEKLLREKNEALETADRLKSEFISNVSYELRTPLHSIIGFSELLQNEYFGELNHKQKEYCHGILSASNQLLSLINDTLDLATIEAGHMTLKPRDFSVRTMLRSLMSLARMHAQKKGVKLTLDAGPDLGEFSGDESRLKQALFNLLSNAIGVSPKGSTVTLTAHREGRDIIFTVTDAGPGHGRIPQRRLFSPFARPQEDVGSTSSAGLSLALVKRLIELHGGQVKFKSKANVGTTVICSLPQRAQLSLDVAA
ncbi:MAG: PAS-domain containing protein, partial [Holosporales bacterium]